MREKGRREKEKGEACGREGSIREERERDESWGEEATERGEKEMTSTMSARKCNGKMGSSREERGRM